MSGEVTVPLELSNRGGGSEAALAPKILSISSKKRTRRTCSTS